MNSVEIDLIQQKAENIQRLRELEQDRTRQILGRQSGDLSLVQTPQILRSDWL